MIGSKRTKEYLARLASENPKLAKVCKNRIPKDAVYDNYAEFLRFANSFTHLIPKAIPKAIPLVIE